MLAVKHQGKPFVSMAPEELDLWGDALLLKIHAITGWTVPEKTMLTVFSDQFKKKIVESYAHTNPDEIEYAFRNYGTAIEDWGKQMNLNMIDKVMIPYLSRRAELSKLEEQVPDALPAPKEDLSDQAMQDWFEHTSDRVKALKCTVYFIPLALYDWLDAKKKISKTPAEKRQYLVMAADYRQGQLIEAVTNENSDANRKKLADFNAMKAAGEIQGDEIIQVKNLAKKMIVFNFIKGT